MKNIIVILLLSCLPILTFSQNKVKSKKEIQLGVSTGVLGVDKNTSLNYNIYAAFSITKNVLLGVDAVLSEDSNFNHQIFMGYAEWGNGLKGLDEKNKFYFSGVMGVGYLQQEIISVNKNAMTLFLGTKLNVNINPNFILGLKSGIYLSKLNDPLIANLFLAYKL